MVTYHMQGHMQDICENWEDDMKNQYIVYSVYSTLHTNGAARIFHSNYTANGEVKRGIV